MGKYKGAFGNGGGFVDNKDYSKEIASEFLEFVFENNDNKNNFENKRLD